PERVEGFAQLPPGHRALAPGRRESGRAFPKETQGVADAFEEGGRGRGPRQLLQAGLLQGDQVAGEVAAVHRRDVAGLERAKVSRVVPVVEVTPMALEAQDGGERGLEAVEHLVGPDPPEVVRGDGREK